MTTKERTAAKIYLSLTALAIIPLLIALYIWLKPFFADNSDIEIDRFEPNFISDDKLEEELRNDLIPWTFNKGKSPSESIPLYENLSEDHRHVAITSTGNFTKEIDQLKFTYLCIANEEDVDLYSYAAHILLRKAESKTKEYIIYQMKKLKIPEDLHENILTKIQSHLE